jgi:hypothetical protein
VVLLFRREQMTDPEQTKQADDQSDLRVEEVADLEAEPSDVDDVKGGPIGCRGGDRIQAATAIEPGTGKY